MFNVETELFPGFSSFRPIQKCNESMVYHSHVDKTGDSIAIKAVFKSSLIATANKKNLENQISILKSLDHPFISFFCGTVDGSDTVYLLSEYGSGGTLGDYIFRHGKLKESDCVRFFCELLSAVRFMHRAGIAHRHLNTDSIILDEDAHIRIIDFGAATREESHLPPKKTSPVAFLPPEVIRGKPSGMKVDSWQLGLILYFMACGCLPFRDTSAQILASRIVREDIIIPLALSRELSDLIMRLLAKDPCDRLDVDEAMTHPWVDSSRYSFYTKDEFMTSLRWRVMPETTEEIDTDVIRDMIKCGIKGCDVEAQRLLKGENSEGTFIYKLLRKKRVIANLFSADEFREMYKMRRQQQTVSRALPLSAASTRCKSDMGPAAGGGSKLGAARGNLITMSNIHKRVSNSGRTVVQPVMPRGMKLAVQSVAVERVNCEIEPSPIIRSFEATFQ